MIRDPSDGTVRGLPPKTIRGPTGTAPSRLEQASGLPLESKKPEQQERMRLSREWLEFYFKRNPEQGT